MLVCWYVCFFILKITWNEMELRSFICIIFSSIFGDIFMEIGQYFLINFNWMWWMRILTSFFLSPYLSPHIVTLMLGTQCNVQQLSARMNYIVVASFHHFLLLLQNSTSSELFKCELFTQRDCRAIKCVGIRDKYENKMQQSSRNRNLFLNEAQRITH